MKSSLIGALLFALACTACGNKGPLYIPQRPVVGPAQPQPGATSADDSKAAAAGAKP